jgi:AraC-like DNA-binding protein
MKNSSMHQTDNTIGSEFSSALHENCRIAPHFHRNFEIIAVLEGSCLCTVNSESYTLAKGEAAFICPLQVHEFALEGNSVVRRITFHEHIILTIFQSIKNQVPRSPVFNISPDLMSMLSMRLDDLYGNDSGLIQRIEPYHQRMMVKGLLYLIGSEFLSHAELIARTQSDTVAMEIAEYISENFRNDIFLHDIAKEKGYNYQYLSRVFNRYTNMNFKRMLNQYRIQHAYAMMQDTELPISHICFECGFQSIRSFNQVCKETFGKTPSELRQRRKQETTITQR